MEIRPNSQQPINRTGRAGFAKKSSQKSSVASTTTGSQAVGFDFFDELVDHLQRMPDTREDFLEKGRRLFNQPDYPNEDHLKELEQALDLDATELKGRIEP